MWHALIASIRVAKRLRIQTGIYALAQFHLMLCIRTREFERKFQCSKFEAKQKKRHLLQLVPSGKSGAIFTEGNGFL